MSGLSQFVSVPGAGYLPTALAPRVSTGSHGSEGKFGSVILWKPQAPSKPQFPHLENSVIDEYYENFKALNKFLFFKGGH